MKKSSLESIPKPRSKFPISCTMPCSTWKTLDTTLSLTPDHYRGNLLRGRILSLQGNPLGALNNLEKAVQVQPESQEAHLFLADAYGQLGREADAQREQAAARSAR